MKIPILMYHQICEQVSPGAPFRGLVVRPSAFRRQMALMHLLGYRGLSMGALMPYLQGKAQGKVFGITFDDGYRNNLEFALPILQRYAFSATCYAVSGMLGQTNAWDVPQGVPQVPLMTIQELRQWIDSGQEVGSHTCDHMHLPPLDAGAQRYQVTQSRMDLERELTSQDGVRHFCYPYGAFDPTTVQAVQQAGYQSATTTRRGRAQTGPVQDLLLLPRVLVSRSTNLALFALKCFSAYEDRRGTVAY